MPASLADILAEIDRLLEPARFQDYCVPTACRSRGRPRCSTVATGVSAHAELFELAAAERAELLLVHHGLFWGSGLPGRSTRCSSAACRSCSTPTSALAAYHLPLDAHPRSATTRCSPARSARQELEPFALHEGQPIGFIAHLPGDGLAAA